MNFKKIEPVFIFFSISLLIILATGHCSREVSFIELKSMNGRYHLPGKKTPFTGSAVLRTEQGQVLTEFHLKAGKLHGLAIHYGKNGIKQAEVHYSQGKKQGISRGWFSSGRKSFEYEFSRGLPDGKSIDWYENGNLSLENFFKSGKRYGKQTRYHWNGKKAEEADYVNGIREGNLIQWYDSSQKKFQCQYRDGRVQGIASSWYENGQKKFKKSFNNNELQGVWKTWYANGNPRDCGELVNGKLDGKWMEWHENRAKKQEVFYQNHHALSILQWYSNGRKRMSARKKNPAKAWNWQFWDKNGQEIIEKKQPLLRGLYPGFFNTPPQPTGILTLSERRTLDSRKKIHEYPVEFMTYYGEYDFGNFISQGISVPDPGGKYIKDFENAFHCSSFMTITLTGQTLFAHNWDFTHAPYLILFTDPPDGYASVSVVDTLGMNRSEDNLHLRHFEGSSASLRAPYYPLEGMNACGLAIACMYVPGKWVWNPGKVNLNLYHIIRLVLDYAANLGEAIQLLENYNNIDESQHFLIADASGKSAVIENGDGGINVIRNQEAWQVATNTRVSGYRPRSLSQACWRYGSAYNSLHKHNGRIHWQQAMQILQDISMEGTPETISSTVYNLNSGEIYLAVGRNYQNIKKFRLNKNFSD